MTTVIVCVFTAGRRLPIKVNLAMLIEPQCIYSFLNIRASWEEIHIQTKTRVNYPCTRPPWLLLSAKLVVYIMHQENEGVPMAFPLSKIVMYGISHILTHDKVPIRGPLNPLK